MGRVFILLFGSVVLTVLLIRGCESISEERFLKLEKKVDIQNSRLSDLESTIHEQDMSIKRLNERLKYMETKLRKNKLKCQNSDSWISKALGYNRRRAVQQNKASVKNENHRVEQTEPVIRNKNYVNTNSKEVVTRGLNKMVAFYAFQSRDVIKPGIHQILVFDVVKTNSENGYNRYSGMFTCSTSGLYVFTSSLAMDGTEAFASFEIVKNADVEGVFFVDAAETNNFVYSSLTIVISLNQGDVVFIRVGDEYSAEVMRVHHLLVGKFINMSRSLKVEALLDYKAIQNFETL